MREVKISTAAQKKIQKLLEYLESEWSEKVRVNFAKKLYKHIGIIKNHPESFPKSETNQKYHKCVITKQTTIFYSFNSRRIDIVSIFDTRQDPNKLIK